ncbi:MAG: glycosyl transferase [Acidimicrobiales bacterium]|nr:glycosyl transferase [Acidimicrobiales bacterium]
MVDGGERVEGRHAGAGSTAEAQAQPRPPRVFAIGHFPPPVHGMSVATEKLTELLEERAEVTRLDISEARPVSGQVPTRRARHHAMRVGRTLRAVAVLVRRARRGDAMYVDCDGGFGMLYTLALLTVARALGLRRYLHHHSYAYVSHRSRLLAVLARVGGEATAHVVTCPNQEQRLRALYPGIRRVLVVPITFVLAGAPDEPSELAVGRNGRFVLGHISNLSLEKGLAATFETLERSLDLGVDAQLVLAGPTAGPQDEAALAAALEAVGPRAQHLGPLYGEAKAGFFESIDAFLFPTRYRHESFGIVAAEAMSYGVPVIAYRAGCLDEDWVGGGGLVMDHAREFSGPAAEQVQAWANDPSVRAEAARVARQRAEAARRAGADAARHLVDLVTLTTADR